MENITLVRELIKDYPDRQGQAEYVKQMCQFMDEYPQNCFERSNTFGHFTASAFILNPKQNKLLLMHHKKLNKWLQMGGHADGDFDLKRVALKEASEESGFMESELCFLSESPIDLCIHAIPPYKNDPAHYHFDVRFLLQAISEDFVKNNESNDICWVFFNEVPKFTMEESILRTLEKINTFTGVK